MIRRIIQIDEEKCNGCGICANACHEGAIDIVDGKAKLVREHYCDGLGDCLPACPTGAITFIEREAPAYDEAAVLENKRRKHMEKLPVFGGSAAGGEAAKPAGAGGCPGSRPAVLKPAEASAPAAAEASHAAPVSQLRQWPCQIQLIPVNAPCFDGARLLIAADCTAYAYANFHEEFMKGCVTLIGCPKLDEADYARKLTAILAGNDIREVSLLRMEVPCCGGLERAAVTALMNSGKDIPWHVTIITIDGGRKAKL